MKIVIPVALVLLLSACSDDKKSSTSNVETTKEVANKQVEKVAPVQEAVKVEAKEMKETSVEEPESVALTKSGKELFVACSACHGADGSKVALGKSQVIKGWDSSKVEDALNGYKNGTYGGAMKGIMKGQVSNLSAEDIKKVSDYISKL